jgi:hypothetical protein
MTKLLVRAFPLKTHKRKQLEAFAAALRERAVETGAFYRRFGVTRESWHLQETQSGPMLISVTEIQGNVEAVAHDYSRASEEFETWFKQQVHDLSGVDPNVKPLGPETHQVFEWCALSEPPPA